MINRKSDAQDRLADLDLRSRVEACFYTWVMEDPYPQISDWEHRESMRGPVKRILGLAWPKEPKPEVSAHKAWREGYDFAKALVMKELNRK